MKKYQREINEQLNKAQRHVNHCEGAKMYVFEQKEGKYMTSISEPKQYLYKVTFENGKVNVASQKHIDTKTEYKPAKKVKSMASEL